MVDQYKEVIRATMPTGEAIAAYRRIPELQPLVTRFLRERRTLQQYVPELEALNGTMWAYARRRVARSPIDPRGVYGVGEQNLVERRLAERRDPSSAFFTIEPAA